MKINEKNLAAIASSSHLPVDKEGWLNKKGENNKGFQKRWFVLKGNLLFYFDKKNDKEPLGVIILEGCTVELSEDGEAYGFNITFRGPGDRCYVLGAESQESMEDWMKVITCASYEYMKVMVAELQKQVDELTELERLKKLGLNTIDGSAPPPVAPPRQRHNPFNVGERETFSGNQKRVLKKRTFADLHQEYGKTIVQARETWKRTQQQLKKNHVKEDILIML